MPSVFDRIYAKSPVWIQNLGISAYGFVWKQRRFGGEFNSYVNGFIERETFTALDWHQYQTEKLRSLLVYADGHVPYYRDLFQQIGLARRDLQNFELMDLPKLPLLEKDMIRENPEAFINAGKKYNTYHTSGTTGTPLAIKWTNETDRWNAAAYEARVRRWAGLNYKMSRAMIGGRLVVPKGDAKPPFWRYNLAEKQLYMSAFHISPSNLADYATALNRFQPDYLVGYASSHYFLARMIDERNISMYQPKAILTSSEKLTDEMRAMLEKVYRCPVFDAYNGVEGSCLVSECEYHRLHVSPDVGIVEIVDERGQPLPAGEIGEVVTTGFLNFDQPLIRYRMGDIASISVAECPCKRQMSIIEELVGRLEDVVIGSDGRETVRFHGIFVGLTHVKEGQIVQHDLADFEIRLVVDEGFDGDERQIIKKRFEERLGLINLRFVYVENIERAQGGKFKAVISNVTRAPAR